MNLCRPFSDALNVDISGKRTRTGLMTCLLIALMLFVYFQMTVAEKPFTVVVYTCLWQRPVLSDFVFGHYAGQRERLLREHNVALELYVVGSEGNHSASLAKKHSAGYVEHMNNPLGAKHNYGLSALKEKIPHLDAVVVVGSDDVLNDRFFIRVRKLMTDPANKIHLVGLRDLFFYDIASERLAYTRGYRVVKTDVAAAIGLGRTFSRSVLDAMNWTLWDPERNRGLDQSAVRRLMRNIIGIDEVSIALVGREEGIFAMDIKTKDAGGTNIWGFDAVIEAVGKNGRFYDFEEFDSKAELDRAFGADFVTKIGKLKDQMMIGRS